jgi:hypothetical protein
MVWQKVWFWNGQVRALKDSKFLQEFCFIDKDKIFYNIVEPASGFLILSVQIPPVSPAVIPIKVLRTFYQTKTLKGLNLNNRGWQPTESEKQEAQP